MSLKNIYEPSFTFMILQNNLWSFKRFYEPLNFFMVLFIYRLFDKLTLHIRILENLRQRGGSSINLFFLHFHAVRFPLLSAAPVYREVCVQAGLRRWLLYLQPGHLRKYELFRLLFSYRAFE